MRIRKGYCHVAPPPELVSSSTTSNQPSPLMAFRINLSSFSSNLHQNPRTGVIGEEEEEDEGSRTKNKSCSTVGTTQTSSTTTSSVSSFFSHHEWWCEEEKIFPLKKRRISLERFTTQQYCGGGRLENAKKIKNKEVMAKEIKSAAAKEDRDSGVDGSNIIMSLRCSRTDGKGWRCRNKRVEGYSMCDHHIKYYPRFRDTSSNVGNNKKRKMRKMMLSSILERTVPLV